MPTTNLLVEIRLKYAKLTKAEKKIADIVLAQPENLINATITELAEICNVGETSVFRFCRTLNLNGYQDFKLSLALTTNTQKFLEINNVDGPSILQDENGLCKEIYQITLDALEATYSAVNAIEIDKAAHLMHEAAAVHFFGLGGSGIAALTAQNKFLKISSHMHFVSDSHMQITTASLLEENSVAVIFSVSGTTKDTLKIARLAHDSGAKVIFITAFSKTPAQEYSDITITCGTMEGPMQGGSISAQVSQIYMINLLHCWYCNLLGAKAVRNKAITAASITGGML